jgi:hypothetical protein
VVDEIERQKVLRGTPSIRRVGAGNRQDVAFAVRMMPDNAPSFTADPNHVAWSQDVSIGLHRSDSRCSSRSHEERP